MKLDKKQFCDAVETFKSMITEEEVILDILNISVEWKPSQWINRYYELLQEMCELDSNPYVGTDLDWFCFETDFGRKENMCEVFDVNTERTWTITTPEILYDFITREE